MKQALLAGGIARANKPEGIRNTPGIHGWEDLVRVALIPSLATRIMQGSLASALSLSANADTDLRWSAHGERQAFDGLPRATCAQP